MSINATDLYEDGPAAGAKAKILLIHFDGAIDAGGAGRMAIGRCCARCTTSASPPLTPTRSWTTDPTGRSSPSRTGCPPRTW